MNVPRKTQKTLQTHVREFDIIGLVLLMGGVAAFLVGLNNGAEGWSTPSTIAPLVVGIAALIGGCINEVFTKQSPIVPPRLFRTRTTAALLGIAHLHAIGFFSVAYYLVLYYQVLGSSAVMAGIRALTFTLGCSITSALGGFMLKLYASHRSLLNIYAKRVLLATRITKSLCVYVLRITCV